MDIQLFREKGDILDNVAKAVKEKTQTKPSSSRVDLVFVGLDAEPDTLLERYRNLQTFFYQKYGVQLLIVGGGFGCETLKVQISASSREKEREIVEKILGVKGDITIELLRAGVDRVFEKEIGSSGGIAVEEGRSASEPEYKKVLRIMDPITRLEALIVVLRKLLTSISRNDPRKIELFDRLEAIAICYGQEDTTPALSDLRALKELRNHFSKRLPASVPVFESINGTLEVLAIEKGNAPKKVASPSSKVARKAK